MMKKCLSLFLSLIIVAGPCFSQDRAGRKDTAIVTIDDLTTGPVIVTIDDLTTRPVIVTRDELTTGPVVVTIDDLTTYFEELAYYRFGEYINGVYVIDLQTQEYIDSQIILNSGAILDIGQIVGDLAIGAAAIIITAIVMPYLVPAMATKTVIAITVVNTTGAMLDGAIAGTIEYARTGGDLNKALSSAANEFKYTSIFAAAGEISSLAFLYKIAPKITSAARPARFARMIDNAIPVVNKLEPNQLHRQINAQYPYYTRANSAGQIDEVYAPLLGISQRTQRQSWTKKGHYKNWLKAQGIPDIMLDGDEAGHLIADILGGSSYWDNIVPMARKLNHGEWSAMETSLKEAITSGKRVENYYVKVIRATPTGRPMAFRVEFDIDGKHFVKNFKNS